MTSLKVLYPPNLQTLPHLHSTLSLPQTPSVTQQISLSARCVSLQQSATQLEHRQAISCKEGTEQLHGNFATGSSFCQTRCSGPCGMRYRLSGALVWSVGEILIYGVWMSSVTCTVTDEIYTECTNSCAQCMEHCSTAKNKLYFFNIVVPTAYYIILHSIIL